VDKFFNWVEKSNFSLFENKENYFIETCSIYQGGIDLSNIFESFGYSKIVEKNKNNIYRNFIRCCCNCYHCVNMINNKLNHSNTYSCYNSDLLCIVIFNEMLIKFGLVTEIVINHKKYTNKSNNLFSDYYYWYYGFYNKKNLLIILNKFSLYSHKNLKWE
jgi:hypothetical protein